MTDMQAAAFFDLDDTLLVGTNSGVLYMRYLVEHKLMSRFRLLPTLYYSTLHKLNLVDIEKLLDRLALSFAGVDAKELYALTHRWFFSDVVSYLAEEAPSIIKWHASQRHYRVLLSASSQYVCELTRDYLSLDHVLCSHFLVNESGKLTGTLEKPICYHHGKVHYAEQFAQKHGVLLERSYFYTDSISDLPLLERVGYPVAVNPDPLLKREADKRGWPILMWSRPRLHKLTGQR